jgi:hypothetical protein
MLINLSKLGRSVRFIFVIISFLLLIYIFYRSEIRWNGTKRDTYLIYYIICLIIFLFSIFTFYLNDKLSNYLLIILGSAFFAIYFFEAYLVYRDNKILRKEQHTFDFDKRNLFEVYRDQKKKSDNVVLKISPQNYLKTKTNIFPLSGISNSRTINCNENGYYSSFLSDRYGFNNPDEEWTRKEIEYFLIGDSFTQGACVNRPHDLSSILRQLSKKGVLNIGYGGNGPLIEYAATREYLPNNVKKVLWIYYEGNDLRELSHELKSEILAKYIDDLNFSQDLKLKQEEINNLASIQLNVTYESTSFSEIYKFIKLFKIRSLFLIDYKFVASEEILEKFKYILKLTDDLAKKNNFKLYFVYLPEYNRYTTKNYASSYESIKNILYELNISYIDIHKEIFEKEANPLKLFPFERYGHYAPQGYTKIAKIIYEKTQ